MIYLSPFSLQKLFMYIVHIEDVKKQEFTCLRLLTRLGFILHVPTAFSILYEITGLITMKFNLLAC